MPTVTITLTASVVEDANTHFDVKIDGTTVATVAREVTNANVKEMIQAAYDRGVEVTSTELRFDSVLDDAT